MKEDHVLYRMFNAENRLLYVGITCSLSRRLKEHSSDKHWWESVQTIELERFTTRSELEAAEKLAIANERPLHNIAGTRSKPKPKSFSQDYVSQLVGKYFHSDDETCWQGRIVGKLGSEELMVELFDRLTGLPMTQRMVKTSSMLSWDFYDQEAQWRRDYQERIGPRRSAGSHGVGAEVGLLGSSAADFISSHILIEPESRVVQSQLFPAYLDWCADRGEQSLGKHGFNRELIRMVPSLSEGKSGNTRFWRGIRLIDSSCTEDSLSQFSDEALSRFVGEIKSLVGNSWFSARHILRRLGYKRTHTYRILSCLEEAEMLEVRQVGVQKKNFRVPPGQPEAIDIGNLTQVELDRLQAVSEVVESRPYIGVNELRFAVGGKHSITDDALLSLVRAGYIESTIDGAKKVLRSVTPFSAASNGLCEGQVR